MVLNIEGELDAAICSGECNVVSWLAWLEATGISKYRARCCSASHGGWCPSAKRGYTAGLGGGLLYALRYNAGTSGRCSRCGDLPSSSNTVLTVALLAGLFGLDGGVLVFRSTSVSVDSANGATVPGHCVTGRLAVVFSICFPDPKGFGRVTIAPKPDHSVIGWCTGGGASGLVMAIRSPFCSGGGSQDMQLCVQS